MAKLIYIADYKFVKKAAKDHPDINVKKGESYYWWKFGRFGATYKSKRKPSLKQLTQTRL